MADENHSEGTLKDVAHWQSNRLWDVIAILDGARQMAESLEARTGADDAPDSINRLLRVAQERVRETIDALEPFI